jgi:hypothetical protein
VTRFKWGEWNLSKIAAHGLSAQDVEYAYEHARGAHLEREDGAYETVGPTPSGRVILIVWRYNDEFDALKDDYVIQVVFVITAY